MDTQGIDQLLAQLRSAASAGAASGTQPAPASGGADFAAALQSAISQVSDTQHHAEKLAKDFELGAPGANLEEVMVALQKANISFQTMVQVRNRLVNAYQEIMNMQV